MKTQSNQRRSVAYAAFFGSIVLLLLISLTSLWLHRTIFTTSTFTSIATQAITAESSRQAIGQQVATRIFEDRPLLQSTLQPRLANFIGNILGTDLAETGIEKGVQQLQILVTTEQKPPVVLNLTSIKDTIVKVQDAIGNNPDERRVDPSKIPDEIMIVDTTKIPNYYKASVAVLWLGPIALITAIGALGIWVYRGRRALLQRLRISGLVVASTAIIALLVGPLVKPLLLGVAENAPTQTLLSNLYAGFIGPFNQQAFVLGMVGVTVIAGTFIAPPLMRYIRKKKEPLVNIKEAKKATK